MTTRDAARAALVTAACTFAALFGTSLLGWLQDLTAWATDDRGIVAFPDPGVLVKAAVAAVAAALAGIVNFAIRWAQAAGVVGGRGPVYTRLRPRRSEPLRADRGTSDLAATLLCAFVAVMIALVVVLGSRAG